MSNRLPKMKREIAGAIVLREIRLRKPGASQEALSELAGIERRTFGLLERGEVEQPDRKTLLKLLNALERMGKVSVADRNFLLESYGFRHEIRAITSEEERRAVEQYLRDFGGLLVPSYMTSISQTLLSWNQIAPHLIGLSSSEAAQLVSARSNIMSIFANPQYGFQQRLVYPEATFMHLVRLTKAEYLHYSGEEWYEQIDQNMSNNPMLGEMWRSVEAKADSIPYSGDVVMYDELNAVVQFHFTRQTFINDTRFRAAVFSPKNRAALEACARWYDAEVKSIYPKMR